MGLLFFLATGVIAFAADFNNGGIYFPDESASIASGSISVDGEMTNKKIESVILEQTGRAVNIDEGNVVSDNKIMTLSALNNDIRFL